MRDVGPRTMVLVQCLMACASALGGVPKDEPPAADVRSYGAICDGRADDTQALIRAGRASLDVLIPPGLTCRVTGPLAAGIRAGQRWHGGGVVTTDDGFNFTVFPVAGKTDVTFDGVEGRSGRIGAEYDTADARFIEFVSGADRGRVLRCRISGFQQGVRVYGSQGVDITDNEINSAYGWGISVQTGAHRTKVVGNRVNGTVHEHGIYASASPNDRLRGLVVKGNAVSGAKVDGIKVTYADGAIVEGNTVSSNGGQGIYLTIGVTGSDVHDNHTQDNADNGILVYDGGSVSSSNGITRNTVRGNRTHGIVVSSAGQGKVEGTRVTENEIEANGNGGAGYGVVVSGSASTRGTVIEGNRIRRQRIGVYVAGGPGTIVGRNECEVCQTPVVGAGVPP